MTTVRGTIIASRPNLNVKIDVAEASPTTDEQGNILAGTKLLIFIDHDPFGQFTPGEAKEAFNRLRDQDGKRMELIGNTPGDGVLALVDQQD